MVVSFTPAGTVLTGAALDIRKTFDCGQCFRFAPDGRRLHGRRVRAGAARHAGRRQHHTARRGSRGIRGGLGGLLRPRARLRGPLGRLLRRRGAAHGLRVFARHPHSRAGPVGDALLVHPVAEQQHPAHPQNHRVALRAVRRADCGHAVLRLPHRRAACRSRDGRAGGDPLRLPRQVRRGRGRPGGERRARPRSAAEAVLRSGPKRR